MANEFTEKETVRQRDCFISSEPQNSIMDNISNKTKGLSYPEKMVLEHRCQNDVKCIASLF